MTQHFESERATVFEVDAERRVIKGLALPFDVVTQNGGQSWSFSKGTVKWTDPTRVKLCVGHDINQAIGYASEIEETDEGLVASFKVARGAEGDRALSLAEDKVLDGLSVGIGQGGKFRLKDGVQHSVNAPLMEISLTPAPAFEDARVLSVAASAALPEENNMTDKVETKTDESVAMSANLPEGPSLVQPEPVREFEVKEESPYRFDGHRGAYDFSTDLINALRNNDGEAYNRVTKFMQDAFAPKFDVDTGNVSTLNPTRVRPDMYVDERKYSTPFYSALYKGTLSDITPFVFPKLNSYSNLVSAHTEGVEPTPGSFSATSQTVTPSAVSGKVEITREVWDQGGNPQVSSLIWNKMVYSYFLALETKAVAMLDAASPTQINLTAGATDDALVNELEEAIAELNFIAGGNVFTFAGTHIDLYKALAGAVDGNGRKLLPIINPTNANGRASSGFKSLDVAGTLFTPAWSLGASGTVSESSYLVDPDSVHVWNSAPQRLEFQYRVAYVDLAIWGYVASAISDMTGVREVTYDPTA